MSLDWNDALARIAACRILSRDWDGHGGEPPRAGAAAEAASPRACARPPGRMPFYVASEGVGESAGEEALADAPPSTLVPHLEAFRRLSPATDGGPAANDEEPSR